MTVYSGTYYDGVSAMAHPVSIAITDENLVISVDQDRVEWPFKTLRLLQESEAELRIGTSLRGDAVLVLDQPAAAALQAAYPPLFDKGRMRRRFALFIGGLIAACALVAAGLFIGIPAASEPLAQRTPKGIEQQIGENLTAQISVILRPCPKERAEEGRAQIEAVLNQMAIAGEVGFPITYWVVRTDMANAFALPGGHVVATRGLFDALGEDQEAFWAVMAHEMGHVRDRHSMQAVYRNAGLSLLLEAITGGSGLAQQAILLGGQLEGLRHTRSHEEDADEAAFAIMRANGMDPAALAHAFEAITHTLSEEGEEGDEEGSSGATWFDSHPNTDARIRAARAAATGTSQLPMTAEEWQAASSLCNAG